MCTGVCHKEMPLRIIIPLDAHERCGNVKQQINSFGDYVCDNLP